MKRREVRGEEGEKVLRLHPQEGVDFPDEVA